MNFIVRTPLRLNLEDPEQADIYQVLKNLDRHIYKSQNQFIVEALKHYINDSGADVLMEQKASEEKRYVTMEGQETMKKELKEELRKELLDEMRAEVVRLLGQYAAGSHWGSREN